MAIPSSATGAPEGSFNPDTARVYESNKTTALANMIKSKIDNAKKLILVVSVRPSFRYTQMLAELVIMPTTPVATPINVPKTREIIKVAWKLVMGMTRESWSKPILLSVEVGNFISEVWEDIMIVIRVCRV